MDVFEAVDSRISCRWFLDKPVAPEIVRARMRPSIEAEKAGEFFRIGPRRAKPFAG
jgi:hypothetical protein